MREKVLETKQLEMAKIAGLLNSQIQQLEGLFSRIENVKTSLESIYESDEELDIFEITSYKNFLGKVTNDVKIQERTIENTRIILRSKQVEVNAAFKEVKILEKLKEKQEKSFYQNYEYVQSKEIDDIASTRYHRVSA